VSNRGRGGFLVPCAVGSSGRSDFAGTGRFGSCVTAEPVDVVLSWRLVSDLGLKSSFGCRGGGGTGEVFLRPLVTVRLMERAQFGALDAEEPNDLKRCCRD
jgi:hypothetical protein